MSTFEFTIDNCILINKQQIKFYTRHLSDRKNSKEIAGEKKFILQDINFQARSKSVTVITRPNLLAAIAEEISVTNSYTTTP